VVGEPAGRELPGAPDDRVDGGNDRDLPHTGAMRGQLEGSQRTS
jgi:hypothetical protein